MTLQRSRTSSPAPEPRTSRQLAGWLLPILLLLAGALFANGLPNAKPEDVGMSSERLARIDAAMEQHIANGTMPGALAMIARHGKVVYFETWGERDREQKLPMTPDTIFRIYSMTKPVTSVAVMMLYEEGKFFLNDPVGKYLPELADMQVAHEVIESDTGDKTVELRKAENRITIRDLLRHTAGLTYGVFGNTSVDQQYRQAGLLIEDHDLADFTARLGKIPLQHEPGTKWHYSVATDVLGRLVEAVSGQSYDQFLEQRIFAPLQMNDTGFWVPTDDLSRFAQMYSPKGTAQGAEAWLRPSDSTELEIAQEQASRNFVAKPVFFSGGGGLVSTASDYMRFSLMLLNGGELDGVRVLSPKSVELMSSDHLGDIPMGMGRSGYGFGLGFAVALDQGDIGELGTEGEYNWGGAAGTRFWIDPEEELIGLYMVQILPHRTTLGSEFRNLVYQAIVD
jgi:CubicO group peptidase (beta-lactamase class C family)